MNCQNHPEVPATAYCRTCGKPICDECRRDAYGTVFCAEHAPVPAAAEAPGGAPYASPAATAPPFLPPPTGIPMGSPYAVPPPPSARVNMDVSPALAFFLGWIPGVGAIYNGQYAKGLVHAVVWGILVSVTSSGRASHGLEPLFGMLIAVWCFYMAFEAYHTARKRRAGEPVDEYSSLIDFTARKGQVPVAGIALIVLGVPAAAAHARSAGFRICRPLLAGAADCRRGLPALWPDRAWGGGECAP